MSAYRGPELLSAAHDVDAFDCGDQALNNRLRRRALRNQREGSSRTWVVAQADQAVAYYASSTAVVARSEATGRAARNQPDPLPAMLLGRLAVDLGHQGEGLAAALLKHFLLTALEVAELTGLRLVLIHAEDDRVSGFYRHFGFEPSPIGDLTLLLLIKDISANSVGTPRLACSHPSSSRLDINTNPQHESSNPPPRNAETPTACATPRVNQFRPAALPPGAAGGPR